MTHERGAERNLKVRVEKEREHQRRGRLGEILGERRQTRGAEQALEETRVLGTTQRPLAPRRVPEFGVSVRISHLAIHASLCLGDVQRESSLRSRRAPELGLDDEPPPPKLRSNRIRRRRRAYLPVQTAEPGDARGPPRVRTPAVVPRGGLGVR